MRAVNLIPADQRGDAGGGGGRSGGGVYVVLGLLGGLAVMALLYGLAAHETSSRRSDVATLTAEAQQAQARAAQLAPYTSFLAMREQRVQAVSQLVDSRFDWAHAFHELGRVLPANKISLTSLDGTVGSGSGPGSGSAAAPAAAASSAAGASTTAANGSSGSSVTSATPPGSIPTFTLTGCAISQAEVALMLDRLRLIEGVKEVSLQSSTQSSAKSSASAAGGSSGGCKGGQPAFSAQVVFVALPNATNSASGSSGSATTVAVTATTPSPGVTR
jgi:Tfp pilus assembly protein PilN